MSKYKSPKYSGIVGLNQSLRSAINVNDSKYLSTILGQLVRERMITEIVNPNDCNNEWSNVNI